MNLSVLFSHCTFSRFGDVAWTQGLLTSLRLCRTTLSGGTWKIKRLRTNLALYENWKSPSGMNLESLINVCLRTVRVTSWSRLHECIAWQANHLQDLYLNKQPDAPIIQLYSVIKLYMFRASSLPIIMEFSTVHSALVSFMQVFDARFQAESGWLCLETFIINLHENYKRRMYSRKLHDDGQGRCPKHVEYYNRINLYN